MEKRERRRKRKSAEKAQEKIGCLCLKLLNVCFFFHISFVLDDFPRHLHHRMPILLHVDQDLIH